jgi:hypothetical protein
VEVIMSERWIVGARGTGGTLFTYVVTVPNGTQPIEVTCEAYGAHGRALREGTQVEPLGPFSETLAPSDIDPGDLVDGLPVGQWLDAMLMD